MQVSIEWLAALLPLAGALGAFAMKLLDKVDSILDKRRKSKEAAVERTNEVNRTQRIDTFEQMREIMERLEADRDGLKARMDESDKRNAECYDELRKVLEECRQDHTREQERASRTEIELERTQAWIADAQGLLQDRRIKFRPFIPKPLTGTAEHRPLPPTPPPPATQEENP